jgi:hypothetical protein
MIFNLEREIPGAQYLLALQPNRLPDISYCVPGTSRVYVNRQFDNLYIHSSKRDSPTHMTNTTIIITCGGSGIGRGLDVKATAH